MTGVFKKAQQSYKKHKSFHFYSIYLFAYQCVNSVAFLLRFCCVSYVFGATVAHKKNVAKKSATNCPKSGNVAFFDQN